MWRNSLTRLCSGHPHPHLPRMTERRGRHSAQASGAWADTVASTPPGRTHRRRP
jgi:hypothetical protein